MPKLSDLEFSSRSCAFLTDPNQRETSMWVEDVGGVTLVCTKCGVCGAENRVTAEELGEQGLTLTHATDCAADKQVRQDKILSTFFADWWPRPEHHLIQVGTDVDDRMVLNCVLCDAELRLDFGDETQARFRSTR